MERPARPGLAAKGIPKGYDMYEVLCEHCLHTERVEGDAMPDKPCPSCKSTGAWLGPFAQAPERVSRRNSRPVLTSPLYLRAERPDRR